MTDTAQAAVAAAYLDAASEVDRENRRRLALASIRIPAMACEIKQAILKRTPEDALAALESVKAEAVAAERERCAQIAENGFHFNQDCCGNWVCDVSESGEPIGEPQCCQNPIDAREPMYPEEIAASIRAAIPEASDD